MRGNRTAVEVAEQKVVGANLSLTPIYNKAVEITELLINHTQMDYAPHVAEIKDLQEKLIELCSD